MDYDGDGIQDLVIGTSDWRDYGGADAYDSSGQWNSGPLRGYVYWARNLGTNEKPKYDKTEQLMIGKIPLEVYGAPSPNFADWDGDGDLDLVCGEFMDRLTYFENIGDRHQPVYRSGRFLKVDGEVLHLELQLLEVVSVDWDGDGDPDLIVGEEDGRVVYLENTGKCKDGLPVVDPPVYFKQKADKVKCGALATPCSFDWDGDGDEDLICGNSAGFIEYIENLSGGASPVWALPVRLKADGEVIRVLAADNGSIQGPNEAKWGYTIPFVADWNMDGLPDVVTNDITGRIEWYQNIGTFEQPRLTVARPVVVDWKEGAPKPPWVWWEPAEEELLVQWRTKPIVMDLNHDGLNDLVVQDHEGFLAFFERKRQGERLVLLPGKRTFKGVDHGYVFDHINNSAVLDMDANGENDFALRDEMGRALYWNTEHRNVKFLRSTDQAYGKDEIAALNSGCPRLLRMNCNWAGNSGRRKYTLVDWDNDGRLDFLVNSASVNFLRNVGEEGEYVFQDMGRIVEDRLAGHTTCPTVVDWNKDGIKDLLIGAEDGHLYYYPRESATELLGTPVSE